LGGAAYEAGWKIVALPQDLRYAAQGAASGKTLSAMIAYAMSKAHYYWTAMLF
jgi:hypothetical protein